MIKLNKIDLLSLNGLDLSKLMHDSGEKSYRAKQLFHSLHKECINEIDDINCISKKFREILKEKYLIYTPKIINILKSNDGTCKYVFKCFDDEIIESVFIPGSLKSKKCTLCISSQVGCAMNCSFCATGKIGFIRNLLPSEIIGQLYQVLNNLKKINWAKSYFCDDYLKNMRLINNIVYMGMGEPLHNYKNVVRSIELLLHEKGQLYSSKRITVSTSGVVNRIKMLGLETGVNLAVSLNSVNDSMRNKVMPINKKWNINKLIKVCREYPLSNHQKITFEYVMISNFNDSDDDANKLVKLISNLNPKINLIAFNTHSKSEFKSPSKDRILAFQKILLKKKLNVYIRSIRGNDINAVCGLLDGK